MGGPGSGRKKGSINGATGKSKNKLGKVSAKVARNIDFKKRVTAFKKAGEPDRVSKVNTGKRERFFTSVHGRGVKG